MLYRAVVAACVAAATIAPAAAQETQGTAAAKPAKEKKICRRDTATGSIMAKKTCRTQAEWDAITEQGRSDLDRVRAQDRSRSAAQGH